MNSSPVTELTGTRWRHLKRGTSYEVVGVAKLQTALTEGLADETPMVVYRNEATGKLSVRSLDEFCDGRFERLGRAAHAQGWPDDQSLFNIADWLEQKGAGGSAKIVREAAAALSRPAQTPAAKAMHDAFMAMCAQRDNPDDEVFQDAIDALGMASSSHAQPSPITDAIKVIRAEPNPFREGRMADGWSHAWATFLNRLGDVDETNELYANSIPAQTQREMALERAAYEFCDKIHRGDKSGRKDYEAFKAAFALPSTRHAQCMPFLCPRCGARGTTDGTASTVTSTERLGPDALGYATRLLEQFVAEHFPHNPDWKPLPDLSGVLTQLDNAITIARDYKERLRAYEGSPLKRPSGDGK